MLQSRKAKGKKMQQDLIGFIPKTGKEEHYFHLTVE